MYFVYFISDGEFIKIGYAKDVDKRICALQVGNPRKLKLLLKLPFLTEAEACAAESYLHKSLDSFSTSGEWFKFEYPSDPFSAEYEQVINGILEFMDGKDFAQISFNEFFFSYCPRFVGKYKIAIDKVSDYILQNHGIKVETSCAKSEIRVNSSRGFRCKRIKTKAEE